MADAPSRLSDGMIFYKGNYIPIEEYRNRIASRNIYNLENEYENNNLFSLRNKGNVANGIASVLNVLPQYNNISTQTNLLGNVADSFGNNQSPLARIGLIMLGKQMFMNSAANLGTKYLGTIDTSQILKGNIKGIWKPNIDNRITLKDPKDKTTLEKIAGFGEKYLGVETYDVFGQGNPFGNKDFTTINAIKNTGEGQLAHHFRAINQNIYKNYSTRNNTSFSLTYANYAEEAGVPLDLSRSKTVLDGRNWFDFQIANPYWNYVYNFSAQDIANQDMRESYSGFTDVQEYAPTQGFIDDNFGDTSTDRKRTIEDFVGGISNLSTDNTDTGLVWGRDYVGEHAEKEITQLRGDDDDDTSFFRTNIRTGLLNYTKNLLNATEGKFVDITRKAFKKKDDIIGFQGAGLWRGNDSNYAIDSGQANKIGVRQHTKLDPYDKFAKLIRFNGNKVYGGNENSVIYDRVLPRIHPTEENGKINTKNLMFSIENLAVGTIKRDKFGVIDDEHGTPIPLSEVGQFAGRIMWFPPYNIEINETATANYNSTVMVGRNEPMYNYMSSERGAVLSFSLLVDYPEQLRNANLREDKEKKYGETGKHKAIADFFAFGGDPVPNEYDVETLEKKLKDLENRIPEIKGLDDPAEPPTKPSKKISAFFMNDRPFHKDIDADDVNEIFNRMYNNPEHYEILDGFESSDNGNGFGLNKDVYFQTGITGTTKETYGLAPFVENISQYNLIREDNQFDEKCPLNVTLLNFFRDEKTRKYYNIEITGEASKLYLNENEKAYNEALGDRRALAAKQLVVRRLAAMFGESVARELGKNNIITVKSTGSLGNSEKGAEAKNMHLKEVKEERSATYIFQRNGTPVDKIEKKLTSQQQKDLENIQDEIMEVTRKLNVAKKNIKENVYNKRSKAMLVGYEASSKNEFYPVFHSQTPEDFHKRLTFLQQCTRQGAAKRYDMVKDDTGVLRAKNSVFGRQPICILRVGDLFYTKVIIETVTIDYADTTWDMNPEGFGMQPMIANITLQMKVIGGQSLKGPIDALQNAVSFNYYANSSFSDKGTYARPSKEASDQLKYSKGIVTAKEDEIEAGYKKIIDKKVREGEV